MLRELGFDVVGYLIWLDEDHDTPIRRLGEDLDSNLRTLDEVRLPVLDLCVSVNVDPNARPYDPRLVESIRKFKGRLLTISVMVGEFDAAIDQIEFLLSIPGEISVPLLRLDPAWDPLRDHPRFKMLIEAGK